MKKKTKDLISRPFPAFPSGLSPSLREGIEALETKLTANDQPRVLVKMVPGQNPHLLLVCIDRCLRFTQIKRVLLLVSSSAKPTLLQAWKTAASLEDGLPLAERYPMCDTPNVSFARGTRVCISTIREMQLCLQQSKQLLKAFDLVFVYDVPVTLSPVWQRVMEAFAAVRLIGFCDSKKSTPQVIKLFDDMMVIGKEEEEKSVEQNTSSGLSHLLR